MAEAATKPMRDRTEYHRAYNLANREKKREYSRQYRLRHPEKTKADALKWKAEHPEARREYVRASQTKRRYGVTRAQHKEMYEAQGHCCAICNVPQSSLKRRLCVDHDHETGKVRALICHHCNGVLGHARDQVDVLKAAIQYLEKHRNG